MAISTAFAHCGYAVDRKAISVASHELRRGKIGRIVESKKLKSSIQKTKEVQLPGELLSLIDELLSLIVHKPQTGQVNDGKGRD